MDCTTRNIPIMLNENPQLKLLPCGAKKQKVAEMYPREPDDTLRDWIHTIQMVNNPHLSEKKVKNKKHLSRKDLKDLVEALGPPKGYSDKFAEA